MIINHQTSFIFIKLVAIFIDMTQDFKESEAQRLMKKKLNMTKVEEVRLIRMDIFLVKKRNNIQ